MSRRLGQTHRGSQDYDLAYRKRGGSGRQQVFRLRVGLGESDSSLKMTLPEFRNIPRKRTTQVSGILFSRLDPSLIQSGFCFVVFFFGDAALLVIEFQLKHFFF